MSTYDQVIEILFVGRLQSTKVSPASSAFSHNVSDLYTLTTHPIFPATTQMLSGHSKNSNSHNLCCRGNGCCRQWPLLSMMLHKGCDVYYGACKSTGRIWQNLPSDQMTKAKVAMSKHKPTACNLVETL